MYLLQTLSLKSIKLPKICIVSQRETKNYKRVYLFFGEASLVAFQKFLIALAHLQLWSIDRNIHSSCFL